MRNFVDSKKLEKAMEKYLAQITGNASNKPVFRRLQTERPSG